MTLKTKLLIGQLPLVLALAVLGVIFRLATGSLGQQASRILADNYRSVLAAQRMHEALDRIDRSVLFLLAGHAHDVTALVAQQRAALERELRVQEDNITEAGEDQPTRLLRAAWIDYGRALDRLLATSDHPTREHLYFRELQPAFDRMDRSAGRILEINQDAMVRKSGRAERTADHFDDLVLAAVLLASLLGLTASGLLTGRLLRPLGVVSATVRRFGQGDLQARARIVGHDEIARLAGEFNTMADRLARYRASSLGELLQAQQASQAAIDALPDPVLVLDPEGQLLNVNAVATRLLKIDPEQPGKSPLDAADPGVRALVERLRAHVMGGRGSYLPRGLEEVVRVGAAGSEYILLPRAAPIYGESGQVSGVAIVLQDITRLFRFDELKNNLVATVAHEFRTPLTSLRMSLHLVTEGVVGEISREQSDLLFSARDDCERLQTIVDDLLNLSRIESGRIDLHKRRVDPQSLIDLALDVHRSAAEDARLMLRGEVAPGCPEAFADPDRVQLVFTNLLSNAIRHAPPGSEIRVSARPEYASPDDARPDGWVRFEVHDQGPGIPVEHQAGLFEKFFRVPGSPEGGSGLGLFIARGIVQAHGGQIGLHSSPGQGTTFWFTVPVAPAIAAATEDVT